jgi:hypothetical protein
VAASQACKELLWARNFPRELGFEQRRPTVMNIDNVSCVSLSKDWSSHHKTKHIDIKYHYVKEYSDKGIVSLTHITRNEQIADLLTKSDTAASLKVFLPHLLTPITH